MKAIEVVKCFHPLPVVYTPTALDEGRGRSEVGSGLGLLAFARGVDLVDGGAAGDLSAFVLDKVG